MPVQRIAPGYVLRKFPSQTADCVPFKRKNRYFWRKSSPKQRKERILSKKL